MLVDVCFWHCCMWCQEVEYRIIYYLFFANVYLLLIFIIANVQEFKEWEVIWCDVFMESSLHKDDI